MRLHRVFALALVIALATAAAQAKAGVFDGRRQGFVAGGALGLGAEGYNDELMIDTTRPMTKLEAGYGLNERLIVQGSARSVWGVGENGIVTVGMMGVGVDYYLEPEPVSLYLEGGLGSWFEAELGGDYAGPGVTGLAVSAGIGLEWSRHWSVELVAAFGDDEDHVLSRVWLGLSALAY